MSGVLFAFRIRVRVKDQGSYFVLFRNYGLLLVLLFRGIYDYWDYVL